MNMLDLHSAALASNCAVYHEFLLRYNHGGAIVYGLVEGKEDPLFYRGLIEQALPHGWDVALIRSGNKDAVLAAMPEFDWTRFPRKRVCFFVDRDLSEFVGTIPASSDNLYVSDGYSIENDVVNFGTFRRTLEEVLNIAELHPAEMESVQRIFEQNVSTFTNMMSPLMGQIVLWRRLNLRCNLNDLQMKDYFVFTNGKVGLAAAITDSNDLVQHAANKLGLPVSSAADLASAEIEFRAKNGPQKFVRGKYFFWLFVESALQMHRSISVLCPRHTKPPKVKVSLGLGNAMVILGPRLRCPQSLQDFIKSTYLSYINELTPSAQNMTVKKIGPWKRVSLWLRKLFRLDAPSLSS